MTDRSRLVAAFDLDGTLTRRETLTPFLIRGCGWGRTFRALAATSPLLVRAALVGGPHRDIAKAALLRRLLAGRALEPLAAEAEAYAEVVVARQLRREIRERLEWHRQEGHEVVIVSASPELYVAPIGRRLGVDAVLATALETDGAGRVTGRLAGRNCRGPEKARRLEQWLGEERPHHLYAYGNSAGDAALLAMADTANRVRRRLARRPPPPPPRSVG